MINHHKTIIVLIIGVLNLFCQKRVASEETRSLHYRIDERYKDRLPETGVLWTKNDLQIRWCLYMCLKDIACASIFSDGNACHGYSDKLHDLIGIKVAVGMKYYELAGPIGNVAAGKTAIQSSYLFDDPLYGPERALDSIRYPYQNEKDDNRVSCSHTSPQAEPFPFWQVDLGSRFLVLSVSFLPRIECCGTRNQRLNITVAETASGPRSLCMYYPGPAFIGPMKTFFCEKPVPGQFVRISRDRLILNPCEIEVYGYPINHL